MPWLDLKNLGPLKNFSLSAASGLVKYQQKLYIIADDAVSLLIIDLANQMQVSILQLMSGSLPQDFTLRKKIKPDFESLVILTSSRQDLLIAVPSGSELNRQTGIAIRISEASPMILGPANFSELYTKLRKEIPELNIEGACATDSTLQLFQRGNGPSHNNAVIHLDLKQVLESVVSQQPMSSKAIVKIIYYDLGLLKKVPLAFTDACADGYGRAVDTARLLAQKTIVFQEPQTSAQIEKKFRSATAKISSVPIIRYPNFAMVT